MNPRRLLVTTLLAVSALAPAHADIVIAQVSPLSGPLGPNGSANAVGAKAYFDRVNSQGGVNGQQIRFITEDDTYKVEETTRLLKLVAQRDQPVAFVNVLGSANISAALKANLFDQLAIPVVGVTPGADVLRKPGSRWVFHTHASDNAQLQRIVTHLETIGLSRVAVAYQDIPFGKAGLAFIEEAAAKAKLSVVGKAAVPSGTDELRAAANTLRQSGAQAYVMVLAPNSAVALVKDARQGGDATPIYGMSYVPVKTLVTKSSIELARGVAIAQVTPNAFASTTAMTREFHATMDKFAPPGTDHSQLHLVGFIAAKVVVEAARRVGPGVTPARLAASLKQLRVDLGGYQVDFASHSDNVGSLYTDIGVVNSAGRLVY
jgi:branched-chain amino acid transport system substrate-binding protein